ncbi:MAG: hypothetical protein CSH37_12930, partial [Thalassolituus sp.]
LSSGLRINSAKDDAAGLAISTRFTSQIKGLDVAVRNAGDGIALAQTAEGALGSINESLQRIRELAVQSANATNSDVDREALQAEVDQLVSEISRTADETDFNGRKLLDGSFSATFQIGANAGQTVDVSIGELTADRLGSSSQSGVSAKGTDSALGNGDLIINGVAIGASRAGDDTSSTSNADASAIAKVEAINRSYDETGVKAFTNENTVAGSEMTGAATSGTLTLNGVDVDLSTATSTEQTRASVVEAINAVSDQTGVVATDSGADSGGVTLVAADGRNVEIAFGGTLTSASTGIAAADTYEGGYTLVADGDVSKIEITGGDDTGNGSLSNSGLAAGSYDRATAATVNTATVSNIGPSSIGGGSFANTVNVAGTNATTDATSVSIAVGDTTSDSVLAAGSSVTDLAQAVNGVPGVSAWEEISLEITSTGTTLASGDTLTFGGTVVTASGAAGDLEALADDINGTDFSGSDLDVSAEYDGTNLNLTIRNFGAAEVTFATSANDVTTTAGTLNGNEATGVLAFVSDDGQDVSVSLSDPTTGGRLFAGNAADAEYTGVNGLENGDLVINGVNIGAADPSTDKASAEFASDGNRILSSEKSNSAIAIASAINEVSGETGVTAEVNATVVTGGDGSTLNGSDYALDGSGDFQVGDQAALYINGVSLGDLTLQADGSGNIDADKAKSDAINLINSSAGKTGVTAEDNGVSITLTAADGRNVSIAIDDKSGNSSSIGALFGMDASTSGSAIGESTFGEATSGSAVISAEASTYKTTSSTVTLTSSREFSLELGNNGKDELEALGFSAGTYGGGEDGQFLSDIDISTFEGAQSAITAIDNAIGQVASQRADLGAIQNRLESTVSNLQVTSENLNAANSRIQDADFAAETAELSRTQVLQQAGISVLAQANAAGQQVLSLLG